MAGDALGPSQSADRPGALAGGRRFPALHHRNFRRYVAGQSVSLVGFWMQAVAQGWLVYSLSGSEFWLGAVAFAGYLPVLCLSPVAGAVVDRVDKFRLILATQTAAMLLAFTLAAVSWAGLASVPLVAVLAALLGIVGAVDLPARQAFLVDLVGADDLPSAIALNATIFNTARVIGPAVAGVLVATVGETPCFVLNGVSYGAALWALGGMVLPPRSAPVSPAGGDRSLRSGVVYVQRHQTIRALLLALGLVSALSLQANVLMPALAKRTFDVGARGYGMLLTAYGAGAVLSALLLARRRRSVAEQHRTLLAGLAVFGVGLLGVAASGSFGAALVAQLVAGLGMVRYTATTNASVQLLVDDAYRGRVMGLHTVMFAGMAPLGSLVLGALATPFGPQPAIVLSGLVPLAVALWLRGTLRADAGDQQ